jgi:hypothetical protein
MEGSDAQTYRETDKMLGANRDDDDDQDLETLEFSFPPWTEHNMLLTADDGKDYGGRNLDL